VDDTINYCTVYGDYFCSYKEEWMQGNARNTLKYIGWELDSGEDAGWEGPFDLDDHIQNDYGVSGVDGVDAIAKSDDTWWVFRNNWDGTIELWIKESGEVTYIDNFWYLLHFEQQHLLNQEGILGHIHKSPL